jgi:hypothetical protein
VVKSKRSSKQPTEGPASLKDTFAKLSEKVKFTLDENGKYYVVTDGRGGRRSVNVYTKYKDGINGAHYAHHGVSGAFVKSFEDINDAWAYIEERYPGVNSYEALRKFHEGIPHNETNISPTWSDVDGETFHRYGAVAYTFTENDDAEMLLKRMEATLRVTGTENGQVDQRSHYYASLFNPNKLYTGDSNKQPFPSTNNSAKEDDEEEFPHSQDYLPEEDLDNDDQMDTASNRSRSSSPSKKHKVDEEQPTDYFDAAILNTSTNSSKYDAVPIVISMPMASTIYDFLLYVSPFKAGLGAWWPEQTRIGKFGLFPGCTVVYLMCPKKLVTSFREYVHHTKMWGKWQLFTSLIHTEKYVTYERKSFLLESLARDPLIQYVKASIHPKHEKELADLLRIQQNARAGQPIFDHFVKNWKKDAITEDGKQLAGEWRVPGPDTDFIPSRWAPPPRNEYIDPDAFSGECENF